MKQSMQSKLEHLKTRLLELNSLLSREDVTQNMEQFRKYTREHSEIDPVVTKFAEYQSAQEDELAAIEMRSDPESRSFAEEEIKAARQRMEILESELQKLLLPKDPNDEKNVFLEIRAGTGGDESALFAGDLLRMYSRFAERQGWKTEVISSNESDLGGYKEVIAMVLGQGAFSRFKYERGVHRVQRVPATEQMGRIHTSTVTVAVLPEAEEVDIEIHEKDIRVDVFRAGGHGGQSVNTTDSAVRITHMPSGLVVAIQDEKSQHKNRDKAMRLLRSRLLEQKEAEAHQKRQDDRRSQVGTGERAEKIRTYNYPQSRLTDHRIGLSLYNLADVVNGDLDQVIDPLVAHYQTEALKEGTATTSPTDNEN